MASGTANSSTQSDAASPVSSHQQQYEQFIDRQLGKTCLRVKLVDFGAFGMGLIGAVLAYLLVIILLDHWVIELGFIGRLTALLLLLGGVGYYVARFLLPLIVRRINPVFAAHAVEQSKPSLKNSLINYLMFSAESRGNQLVHRALRQRAALDLRSVNVDTAVDWTHFIRVGYAVVLLMVLFAGYTILSPKDVFQTVFRVAAPWANIARPACVKIIDIKPGDQDVFRGQQVVVSARVDGVDAADQIVLRYTSQDSQTVDQAVVMEPTGTGRRYQCNLPGDESGIQQDLLYRIEAGDAHTVDFRLTVLPAPTILVERIEYAYPAYTGLPNRTVQRQGDIHAPEGTRVTIVAKASHPIASAYIEFDPIEDPPADMPQVARRNMRFQGQAASFSFPLKLSEDESASEYASYQLTFTSQDDLRSQHAVVHKISVVADLAPEITILTPEHNDVEVPEDGSQRFEIRALDPDYGLTQIQVHATVGEEVLLQEVLFRDTNGQTGQLMAQYDFFPRKLGLSAGDPVTLWAVAEDGRTSSSDGSFDPNRQRTGNYHLTITPAEDKNSPRNKPEDAANTPDDDTAQDSTPPSQDSTSNEMNPSNQDDGGTPDDGGAADQSEQSQSEQGQSEQGQSEQGQSEQGQSEQGQSEQGQSEQGQTGSEAGDGAQQDGSAGNQGDQSSAGGSSQTGSKGAGMEGSPNTNDKQQATSGAGDTSSGGAADQQPTESNPSGSDGQGDRSDGSTSGSDNTMPLSENDNPEQSLNNEPIHDGDAFDRAMEHFQRQDQQQGKSPQSKAPNGKSDTPQTDPDGKAVDDGGDGVGDASKSSDTATSPKDSANQSPSGNPADSSVDPSTSNESAADKGTHGSDPNTDKSQTPSPGTENGPTENSPNTSTETDAGTSGSDGSNGDNRSETDNQGSSNSEKQTGDPSSGDPSSGDPSSADPSSGDPSSGDEPSLGKSGDQSKSDAESGAADPSAEQQGHGGEQQGHGGEQQGHGAEQQGHGGEQQDPKSSEGGNPSSADSASDAGSDGGQSESMSGSQDGSSEPSSPSDPQGEDATPKQDNGSKAGGGGTTGGGGDGGSSSTDVNAPNEVPDGDEANLQYTRKATDLVLERLKDQQNQPDPELLESLRWTPEELRQFIRRWESLKQAAREDPADGQMELDDALRSLGLRRAAPLRHDTRRTDDSAGGLRDTGGRSQPPAGILDQYHAYKKGSARIRIQPKQ